MSTLATQPAVRLRSKLETARGLYRTAGVHGIAGRIARSFGYRRVILFELPLAPLPPLIEPELPLTYGFLAADELEAFARYRPEDGGRRAPERLARNERCFVARHGERIVSARWIVSGAAHVADIRMSMPLPVDVAHVYDTYVPPDVRGRGVSGAAATRLARALAAEGFTKLFATVLPENTPGLRNARRAGYAEVGRMAVFALGPLGPVRVPAFRPRRPVPGSRVERT